MPSLRRRLSRRGGGVPPLWRGSLPQGFPLGADLKTQCRIKANKRGVVTLISKARLGDEPPKVRPSVACFTRSEGWRLETSSTNVRRTYGRTKVKQSRLSVAVIRHAVAKIPPAGCGFVLCQAESVPSRISGARLLPFPSGICLCSFKEHNLFMSYRALCTERERTDSDGVARSHLNFCASRVILSCDLRSTAGRGILRLQ